MLSDVQKYRPTTFDVPTGNYNAFWLVERDFDNRTSLITDPPDGRMPPLQPQAAGRTMKAFPTQTAEGPSVRGRSDQELARRLAGPLGRRHARHRTTGLRSSFLISSDDLKLTERLTRVGPSSMHYEVTVDDRETWTRPWTFMIPLQRTDQHIYEYASHEGNVGLAGILAGARAEEASAGKH